MIRTVVLVAVGLVYTGVAAQVVPTGSMRGTMTEGQLGGLVVMDSIARPGVYGIGPVEFLAGEITLVDGRCYVSRVGADGAVVVVERTDVKAPFFVRAMGRNWNMVALPAEVIDLSSLDAFLTRWAGGRKEPFLFRLSGLVGEEVEYHVMNVPPGTVIRGRQDARVHQVKYVDRGTEGTLIGFFSTEHHGVFVHHDANIHVHYLSFDHARMGHVDGLRFDPARVLLEVAE